jgi:N-methylhydantoinase B
MTTLDTVTLAVLAAQCAAAAEEMAVTLKRCARSLYVKESTDFGVGLVTPCGRMFATPRGHGSSFVGFDFTPVIAASGALEDGDVVITNHPYRSGGLVSHTPDITLLRPYFHDGALVCYGYDYIHSTDVGGKVPSSISPTSHELYQEGLLIPPMKLRRRGAVNRDLVTLFRSNVRTPDLNLHDLDAMQAALETGAKRVARLIEEHGVAAFCQGQSALIDYAASRARAALRCIPDGTHEFWDYLDDDAVSGVPVRFRVRVELRDGRVHLDFTGTDPQVLSAYNLPSLGLRHPWLTQRLLHFVTTHDPGAPLNAGLLEPVSVTVPQGTILNPEFPAATGVRHAAGYRLNDAVVGALLQSVPGDVPTPSGGAMVPVVLAEHDARTGRRNVLVLNAVIVGSGARYGSDGYDGVDGSISTIRNTPAEKSELEAGVEVLDYGLRPDSAGSGRWRGGLGLRFTFRVTQDGSMVLGRGLERLRFRPWGAAGGRAGARTRVILNPGTDRERDLGKIDAVTVAKNDVVRFLTPGGGGYGDPFLRDEDAVLADLRAGFVSAEAAARDYGVVVREGAVDQAATRALRAARPVAESNAITFDFGPERRQWEALFSDELMQALNEALLRVPVSARARRRREVFEAVLPRLRDAPHDDPAELITDPAAQRAVLTEQIAALTRSALA